jgi:hypothetical protein
MALQRALPALIAATFVVVLAVKLFRPPTKQRTRLTREQAIEVASRAVEQDPRPWPRAQLTAIVQERSGNVIWVVSPLVKGWAFTVEVDDQTGRVVKVTEGGVR